VSLLQDLQNVEPVRRCTTRAAELTNTPSEWFESRVSCCVSRIRPQ